MIVDLLTNLIKEKIESKLSKDIETLTNKIELPNSFIKDFYLKFMLTNELSFDLDTENLLSLQIEFDNYFNEFTSKHQEELLDSLFSLRKLLTCLKDEESKWFSTIYKREKEKITNKITELYKSSVDELKDYYMQKHLEKLLKEQMNSDDFYDDDDSEDEEITISNKKKYQ